MRHAALLVATAFALGACGSAPPPAEPAPPQKTVLDPQIKALEKAKAVEQQVDDAKAAQDKKLEDAGG